MNRSDFKRLTKIRLREARTLLRAGLFEGAYYLCGYAIEYVLKACIAKQTRRYDFPDKDRVNKSHVHDLVDLVRLGGVKLELDAETQLDSTFRANWNVVKDWSEKSRYGYPSEQEAHDLYTATANSKHGVLKWIKRHW